MSTLTTLRCPSCGAPVRPLDTRCDYCGSIVLVSQPAELALPAIAQAQKLAAQMRERIALNPYDGDAYYQLGLAAFTLGRYDQAENAFEQAQRYLPGSAVAYYFRGLAMLLAKQEDILGIADFRLRAIQRQLEMARELDPHLLVTDAYLDFLRGLQLRNREKYREAIAPLQQAAKALPDLAILYKVLAACYFQINDLPNVIRAAKRGFELRPTDQDLAYMLGVAHARLEQFNEMENYARRVAVLRGDSTQWYQVVREFHGKFD
ncbi:MAG: tetratricopeptide repeat protein [Anaerolineae bacterium]|nr:tetratricopeptide repeat protein [Anaerolineae bacterium]